MKFVATFAVRARGQTGRGARPGALLLRPGAGRGLKTKLLASAGLGQRLANSWRDRHYPNQKFGAANRVCTKASQIGLIILRDGDPGEPEQALGGFENAYCKHAVEIEVYVAGGDAAARDAAYDTLGPADRRHHRR